MSFAGCAVARRACEFVCAFLPIVIHTVRDDGLDRSQHLHVCGGAVLHRERSIGRSHRLVLEQQYMHVFQVIQNLIVRALELVDALRTYIHNKNNIGVNE